MKNRNTTLKVGAERKGRLCLEASQILGVGLEEASRVVIVKLGWGYSDSLEKMKDAGTLGDYLDRIKRLKAAAEEMAKALTDLHRNHDSTAAEPFSFNSSLLLTDRRQDFQEAGLYPMNPNGNATSNDIMQASFRIAYNPSKFEALARLCEAEINTPMAGMDTQSAYRGVYGNPIEKLLVECLGEIQENRGTPQTPYAPTKEEVIGLARIVHELATATEPTSANWGREQIRRLGQGGYLATHKKGRPPKK